MRKKLTISIGVLLSVMIAACGGANTTTSNQKSEVKSETTAETTEKETASSEISDASEEADITETSDASDSLESTEATEPSQEDEAETIYNMGETAVLKDWKITISNMQILDSIDGGYGTFKPETEGNKYLVISVTAENTGKQAGKFMPSVGFGDDVGAKLLFGDGYEFTATTLLGYSSDMHDSTVNPLSSQSGEIAFDIPPSVSDSQDPIFIQFHSGNDFVKIQIR